MAAIPKLNEAKLEALSDILGATDTGLTGSEIGRYLGECDCPDPIPNMTKRHRLKAALAQKEAGHRPVLKQGTRICRAGDEPSSFRW
jgi:DNA-binding transcriptional MerR regulator